MKRFVFAALLAALATPALADSQDLLVGLKKQGVKPLTLPTPSATPDDTTDPVQQIVAQNQAALAKLSSNVSALLSLFGTGDGAIAESLQYKNIQDGKGHDCAVAGKQFTQIVHDHPLALTGDFIDDVENGRVLFSAVNQICNLDQCGTVFNEFSAQVSKLVSTANGAGSLINAIPGVGTVGTTVGAVGTVVSSANPFTIACNAITKVTLAAPLIPDPTPAPTPTPTPTGN